MFKQRFSSPIEVSFQTKNFNVTVKVDAISILVIIQASLVLAHQFQSLNIPFLS